MSVIEYCGETSTGSHMMIRGRGSNNMGVDMWTQEGGIV